MPGGFGHATANGSHRRKHTRRYAEADYPQRFSVDAESRDGRITVGGRPAHWPASNVYPYKDNHYVQGGPKKEATEFVIYMYSKEIVIHDSVFLL